MATFVMHQSQHLCAIAPDGASLMLLTLRFADEVIPEYDLKRRVQENIKNKETHSLDVKEPASDDRPTAQVIDLMSALKASLENTGRRKEPKVARSSGKNRKRLTAL